MDEIRMAEMFAGASERDRAGEERSKAENERLRIADAQREILRNQRLLEEARFHQDEANRGCLHSFTPCFDFSNVIGDL